MKKGKIFALLLSGCLLTACGSGEKVIEGEVSNRNVEMSAETTDGLQESQTTEAGETAEDTVQSGYVFMVNGVSLEIDAAAQDVLEKLEEPVSVYESPSCAFGDLDKIYTFSGYEMDTYTMDGTEYISSVVLRDDTVETPEGAYIGNTAEQIRELYGNPDVEEDTILTYAKESMKLCFLIKDGMVVSIEYRNTVLD